MEVPLRFHASIDRKISPHTPKKNLVVVVVVAVLLLLLWQRWWWWWWWWYVIEKIGTRTYFTPTISKCTADTEVTDTWKYVSLSRQKTRESKVRVAIYTQANKISTIKDIRMKHTKYLPRSATREERKFHCKTCNKI